METHNWKLILAIVLTSVGFVAVVIFNIAYFTYVLPAMKRRNGIRPVIQSAFGLVHSQVFEYCRLAQQDGSEKHRKVALVVKVSLAVFGVAFLLIGILVLMDIQK